MVLKDFTFFNEDSIAFESDVLENTHGDELILSVITINESDVDITIEGSIKSNLDEYDEIAMLNIKDFNMSTHITSGGNYICPVKGIAKIRCINNSDIGNVVVYGKLVN